MAENSLVCPGRRWPTVGGQAGNVSLDARLVGGLTEGISLRSLHNIGKVRKQGSRLQMGVGWWVADGRTQDIRSLLTSKGAEGPECLRLHPGGSVRWSLDQGCRCKLPNGLCALGLQLWRDISGCPYACISANCRAGVRSRKATAYLDRGETPLPLVCPPAPSIGKSNIMLTEKERCFECFLVHRMLPHTLGRFVVDINL